MSNIDCTIELKPQYHIKARLPRKLKKDIIKVAGREAYKGMISKMEHYYSILGYKKFNIKRK